MSARAGYLEVGPERVFFVLHPASADIARDVAVMLCPPLGWDDITSYRSRRDWAEHLAARGHAAMRFDLPGTGDSAGVPEDAGRVGAWLAATAAAARSLRAETGCRRVVALGIGLGGMLAVQSAAAGAPIDDMILWGVSGRGRSLLRELELFARLETERIVEAGAPEPPPLPEGAIAPGGFLVSPETAAGLRELDVERAALEGAGRRVLLLDRDGLAPDARLRSHLEASGADVAVEAGRGFAAMTAQPDQAQSPLETFAVVDRWLAADAGAPAVASLASPVPVVAETLDLAGVREQPLWLQTPGCRLFGIAAHPTATERRPLTLVLLNPGAIHRIGPNRMWVRIARRWAELGVTTVRLDLLGIGDSDGESGRYSELGAFHQPEMIDLVRRALDALADEGLPRRFVVSGLCSGAYWAFHAALQDERVAAAVMLNARALYWDEGLEVRREARRVRLLSRGTTWRRLLRGEVGPRRLWRFVVGGVRLLRTRADGPRAPQVAEQVALAFDRLREQDHRAVFIFADGEPLRDELEAAGQLPPGPRWPNVEFIPVPGRDHTLRPLWMHEAVDAAVDRAVRAELGRAG
jgi:alpha-beta hydrolase superfamily lysophospholipase